MREHIRFAAIVAGVVATTTGCCCRSGVLLWEFRAPKQSARDVHLSVLHLEPTIVEAALTGKLSIYAVSNKTQLSAEGSYVRGLRHGRFVFYNRNGRPVLEENYFEGQLHGLNRFWTTTGLLGEDNTYCQGILHGPYIRWWGNGRKEIHGYYDNGRKTGTWRSWHPNGSLDRTAEWDNGFLVATNGVKLEHPKKDPNEEGCLADPMVGE